MRLLSHPCRAALAAVAAIGALGLSPLPAATQESPHEVSLSTGTLRIERHQGRLLRLAKPAGTVFIANPEIADVSVKSSRIVYIFGKSPGKTTLFAMDRGDNLIADLEVVVTHDLKGLRDAIATLLPAGKVSVDSVQGAILLSGKVATAAEAENVRRLAARFVGANEEVINRLAVTGPNQINLRVRFAEVSRRAIKEIGVNFDIFDGKFGLTLGETFLQNPNPLRGLGNFNLTGAGTFGVASVLSANLGTTTLSVLLEAFEEMGMARTLAEPNLTALSGETASFLAGGEFPIPISQNDSSITIEFKEFGVSLSFTPTIISEGRISMRVRPEVSQLSEIGAVTVGGLTIPSLTTRRAETTIEIGSGQSFAIAGLIQDDFQDAVRQLPYLGDLPILGALFRSEEFQRNETELIIVVTPYIVRPTDAVPLPGGSFLASNDPVARRPDRTVAEPQTVEMTGILAGAGPGARYVLD